MVGRWFISFWVSANFSRADCLLVLGRVPLIWFSQGRTHWPIDSKVPLTGRFLSSLEVLLHTTNVLGTHGGVLGGIVKIWMGWLAKDHDFSCLLLAKQWRETVWIVFLCLRADEQRIAWVLHQVFQMFLATVIFLGKSTTKNMWFFEHNRWCWSWHQTISVTPCVWKLSRF